LPFYKTGTIEKNPLGEADIKLPWIVIEQYQPPPNLRCRGFSGSPHAARPQSGVLNSHCGAVSLKTTFKARNPSRKDCWVMVVTRGAWQEWDIGKHIEMAVPMVQPGCWAKALWNFSNIKSQKGWRCIPRI